MEKLLRKVVRAARVAGTLLRKGVLICRGKGLLRNLFTAEALLVQRGCPFQKSSSMSVLGSGSGV